MTRRLLLLNGLAVIGAVVNHATGWGFTSLFWWTDRYEHVAVPDFSQLGTGTYYGLRFLEQLVTFSVPAFLFVSGFFVAFAMGRQSGGHSWLKVGTRIRTLLIPYCLWSLAIFVGRSLEGSVDTSAGYLKQLLFGGAAEPYYYIPLLTQLYVLAPFFVGMIRRRWKPVLLVAGLLQAVVLLAQYPLLLGWDSPMALWISSHTPGWFFPHMVFWFVFGTFAGFHLTTFKQWVAKWRRLLPWVTAGLGILAYVECELILRVSGRSWFAPTPTLLDSLYSGAFILTFVAFAQSPLPISRPLDALGERSFGVYLIHAPVLEMLSRLSYHLAPLLLGHQLLFQPLLIIVGLAIPILIMVMVDRSPARPCYNYLFG